ncbi:MAG: hypothetical protein EON98_10215, partial [Chitinophagaceae bacterium]
MYIRQLYMRKPDIRYWVLWLFLLGVLIIVFLQVISGYNITRLLEGNRQLTGEMKAQYSLRKLQSDIIAIESDIRGAVLSGNEDELADSDRKIVEVGKELQAIRQHFTSKQVLTEVDTLEHYVHEKISFSQEVLTAFHREGKEKAALLINTNRGKITREKIERSIDKLDTKRKAELDSIGNKIERTGGRARLWGLVIAVIALLAVVSAFWYILNQG